MKKSTQTISLLRVLDSLFDADQELCENVNQTDKLYEAKNLINKALTLINDEIPEEHRINPF